MSVMRDLIAQLPMQLRWAATASIPDVSSASEGLVLGMGGSGFAGDVAAVFADAQGRRVSVHKGYGLPGWAATVRPGVVAVSHSGNTEETISGVAAATAAGLSVTTTSTGGALATLAQTQGLPHLAVPPDRNRERPRDIWVERRCGSWRRQGWSPAPLPHCSRLPTSSNR